MSFIITVYVPTGIVMASDSRQSITIEAKGKDGTPPPKIETLGSDFVYKTFLLEEQQVGVSSFGEAILGKTTIESHIKSFSEEVLDKKDDVTVIPGKLLEFFRKSYPQANTSFHVAGFKKIGRKSVPHVFRCQVAGNILERTNVKPDTDNVMYGTSWGGEGDIIAALIKASPEQPKPPIIWDAMTVQDAIDFAIYAVRTTIDTMRFQARAKNVGGPVDVLLLRPDEPAVWIQRKQFRGEPGAGSRAG